MKPKKHIVKRQCHVLMVAYTNYLTDARVRREAEAISDAFGCRVRILVLKERARPRTYDHEGIELQEINVRKYMGRNLLNYLLSYVHFLMRAFVVITKDTFRGELDVLHIHNMPNFMVLAGIVPRIVGRKMVLDIHDTMVETFIATYSGRYPLLLKRVLAFEERFSCRWAHRIICVNDVQRRALTGRGIPDDKITTLLNVPDNRHFDHRLPAVPGSANGGISLIYHGTVTRRLGIDLAIRAVVDLKPTLPELNLTILGNGDAREDLMGLASELGAREYVHFIKTVPFDEMLPILRKMDLEVIPNRRNVATDLMLPVKLLECIALGIPVVAPRLETIMHYFTEEQLFFFDPGDMDSLIQTLVLAAGDEDLRTRKVEKARQFLDKYGWHDHKKELIGIYEDLLRKGGK